MRSAVPGRFYRPFGEFPAGNGLTAVTRDWRGVGRSAPDHLPGFEERVGHMREAGGAPC